MSTELNINVQIPVSVMRDYFGNLWNAHLDRPVTDDELKDCSNLTTVFQSLVLNSLKKGSIHPETYTDKLLQAIPDHWYWSEKNN